MKEQQLTHEKKEEKEKEEVEEEEKARIRGYERGSTRRAREAEKIPK